MSRLQQMRIADKIEDSLILLEHPPTITLGKQGGDILVSDRVLAEHGLKVFQTRRAGKATLHSPGQAIIYPVINIKNARLSVRGLVADLIYAVVDTARIFGVDAYADLGDLVGAWVGGRKLAAIGLQINEGVCMHGLMMNVNNDVSLFDTINGCGLARPTTSLSLELGAKLPLNEVQMLCAANIEKRINARLQGQASQYLMPRPASQDARA